jgi:heat shock protein HslJ
MRESLRAAAAVALLLAGGEARAAAPTPEQLAGATYRGVLEHPVSLSGGVWEGEAFAPGGASRPRVELARDFRLTGDLDGDGAEEAVAVLVESSGGSGTRSYLAVVALRGEEPVNLGTAAIGDRVQIRGGRVAGGRVELDLVQAGPDDAACCPSQRARRVWALRSGGLEEGEPEITGKLSLADLRGEWVLTHFAWKEPAPQRPEITLRFAEQGISGRSGCNEYSGTPTTGVTPGDLRFGPIGATQIGCPKPATRLEQRYLAALGATFGFGFVSGKLALSYLDGNGVKALLFAPREASRPDP